MTQASLVQDGIDRVQSAVDSIDRRVQELQKEFRERARDLEKRLASGRRRFEKQARKNVERARAELRGTPAFQRADALRKDVGKRVERGVEDVLGTIGIASNADLRRIDRKLNQINRRLRDMEKDLEERARHEHASVERVGKASQPAA